MGEYYKFPIAENIFNCPDLNGHVKDSNTKEVISTLTRVFLNNIINCQCTETIVGIVNTVYKFQLADFSVTENRIKNLEKTLDLYLNSSNATISFPINEPGFAVSIPNTTRPILHLGSLLKSEKFSAATFNDTGEFLIPIGMDENNELIISKLNSMPHCIIAGTTGSGKSVCLNSVLSSLLFQSMPGSIEFVLIDPKKVELSQYENLNNYLLTPIITEVYKVYIALSNVIDEMNHRYFLLKSAGVKNIEEYNIKNNVLLNRIVVVVDELADLYATSKREIEPLLIRIAQLGRAAGIHLILATQYPSCKVVSSELKVNIPTKIAFSLAAKRQSTTILDQPGAEKLLGKGDGLYCDGKTSNLIRFQCPFVSAEEIDRLTDFLVKASTD